jgi:hypothetical protein
VAGSYGDGITVDDCPETIKAAIKMIVARIYQQASPEPLELALIPKAAAALLDFDALQVFEYRP